MDWTIYWFMFPVSIGITTVATMAGIGGPALFIPVLYIVFPLLGPDYPLQTAVAGIGAALLTQTFGFSSAFVGYYRRRLIDFASAGPFIAVGVPAGIAGALIASRVDGEVLKGCYGGLMLVLAVVLIRRRGQPLATAAARGSAPAVPEMRRIVDHRGVEYRYPKPRLGAGALVTAAGALLTGMVSVGIGEVLMPLLMRRNRVPLPVAAATSVLIVITVVIASSFTLVSTLIARGGLAAVPWNLVCYTIPAVIIGGQIGPRLQGRISQRRMEPAIGTLFAAIGAAMLWIVGRSL